MTKVIFFEYALIYLRSGHDRNEKISNYCTASTQVDFFDLCDANKLGYHSVSVVLASQSLLGWSFYHSSNQIIQMLQHVGIIFVFFVLFIKQSASF